MMRVKGRREDEEDEERSEVMRKEKDRKKESRGEEHRPEEREEGRRREEREERRGKGELAGRAGGGRAHHTYKLHNLATLVTLPPLPQRLCLENKGGASSCLTRLSPARVPSR